MLMSECIKQYIEKNKSFWKERTLEAYNEKFAILLKKFGDVDIDIFTQDFFQEYITTQQKEYKRKATAIRGELRPLLSAIRPYKTFDRFKYITTEQDLKQKQIYSQEDIEQIQDYILSTEYCKAYKKGRKKSYIPIMIAINTGMRLSEIIGLKWKDIDFKLKHIKVQREVWRNKQGKLIESLPKTKCGYRTIPINDILSDYLLEFKPEDLEFYVISNSNEPRGMREVQRTNERLLKKLGIKYLGFHTYRHCFTTKLLNNSGDFKSISEILGHSSIAITQNIYNHPSDEQKTDVIKKAFGETEKQFETIKQQAIEQFKQQATIDYMPQIKMLQDQINDLRVVVARLTQYVQDNLNTRRKIESGTYKYKIISDYGQEKYYKSKKELLEDLDINYATLKNHLDGEFTLLDQIGVKVVEI